MRAPASILMAVLFALAPYPLLGQEELEVEVGDRVRVTKECRQFMVNTAVGYAMMCSRHTGGFVRADSEAVVLDDELSGARLTLALDSVKNVAVYRGRVSLGMGKGAGIGSTLGGATGIVLDRTGWLAAVGAVVGFVAGGLISYERWETLRLGEVASGPPSGGATFGLAAVLRF